MNITWIGSPNFSNGREGTKIDRIIIHWMVGTLSSTDSVFQNTDRNTSAHFGVEDGNVHQYVQEPDTAYHAGNWGMNLRSIGIEHSAAPGRDASPATLETSANLIADLCRRNGIPCDRGHILKHSEVVATSCPGTIPIDALIARANEILGGAAPAPQPAPNPTPANTAGTATVTVDLLYVRSAPNRSAGLAGSRELHSGDTFDYQGLVQGESVNGVSTWIHSTKGNYVWAGGTNLGSTPATTPPINSGGSGTAEALRTLNVRVAPDTSAALGGSQQLQPGQTFKFVAKVHGETVSQNGITSDIWYRSEFGNFVWSGNVKEV